MGKRAAPWYAALMLVCALNWALRLRGPLDLRWDAGVYYILGASLAQGSGYRLLNEPGEIQAVQYPPMLPALIAVQQRLLGSADPERVTPLLRAAWMVLYFAYVSCCFLLFSKFFSPALSFCCSLLVVVNAHTTFLSDLAFAEIPFALTSVAGLLASRWKTRLGEIITGVCSCAAYLFRTAGIALGTAWVAEAALNRRGRSALLRAVVVAIPAVCWIGYIRGVESSPEYGRPAYSYQRADYLFYNVSYVRNVMLKDPFRPELGHAGAGDLAVRLAKNLWRMPYNLGEAVSSSSTFWRMQLFKFGQVTGVRLPELICYAALVSAGLLVLWGTAVLAWRREWLLAGYILLTIAAVASAPWPSQHIRYLVPLTPVLALALVTGLSVRPAARRWFVPALVIALIVQSATTMLQLYRSFHSQVRYRSRAGGEVRYSLFYYEDGYSDLDKAIDWLMVNGGEGVVAASSPHWVFLRTGRKAVMPPFEPDPALLEAQLDSVPVRYMLLDALPEGNFTRTYAAPAVENSPQLWRLVYGSRGKGCRIYERAR